MSINSNPTASQQNNLLSVSLTPVIILRGFSLKGLSHEIDFKNFDKKLHNLA